MILLHFTKAEQENAVGNQGIEHAMIMINAFEGDMVIYRIHLNLPFLFEPDKFSIHLDNAMQW